MLKGELLRKTDKYALVDLGFDVIKVPKAVILKIEKDREKTVLSSNDEERLYVEKRLTTDSISKAVERFSSSVVVVKRNSGGMGSGFFVNPQGYLITNFHVIKNERHFTIVRFIEGKHETRREVYNKIRIVAVDPLHDLAVLKIDEELRHPITPVVLTPNGELTTGETVFAIGHPLGLERTVTEGILSHKSRMIGGLVFLQVDAPINPGNSGGPLFNANGEVIGVNNMGAAKFISEGLNFAIPIREVKYLLNHLEAYAFNESNPETGYVYCPPPGKFKATEKKEKKK